jgi:hypothetical protein
MKTLSLTAAAVMCLSLASVAQAATKRGASPNAYDGRWSVMVITEQGACDRASRLSLGISNGRIEVADAMAAAAGTVDARGRVAVRVMQGADVLAASGSLGAGAGSGKWRAPSKQCAGRWVAERRG